MGLMLLISKSVRRSNLACVPSLRMKSATDERSLEIRRSQMSYNVGEGPISTDETYESSKSLTITEQLFKSM